MEFLLLNQIKSVIRKLSSRLTVLISIFFLSFKLFVLIHCLIPHGREQVKYYFCQRGRDPALITEPVWTFQLLIAYGMGYTRKVPCLCSTTQAEKKLVAFTEWKRFYYTRELSGKRGFLGQQRRERKASNVKPDSRIWLERLNIGRNESGIKESLP